MPALLTLLIATIRSHYVSFTQDQKGCLCDFLQEKFILPFSWRNSETKSKFYPQLKSLEFNLVPIYGA